MQSAADAAPDVRSVVLPLRQWTVSRVGTWSDAILFARSGAKLIDRHEVMARGNLRLGRTACNGRQTFLATVAS
ncbi:hypothetical protein [Rhizorhapis sp. SPR117]|uniref:hypothetical protein n=1 Tax=Rhizorhapis sp. SPR117 TaxID=2912611 RepID=UPI001F3FB8D9|nr:hypothetical protein [Rhizorhapis sp. SPR117]